MKKIFIIAGEASGDYIGAALMRDIKSLEENVMFYGVGGQCMQAQGMQTIFSINQLSIIGIVEVVGKIFHIKRLIDYTVQKIAELQPDVVVTIDSSGFTHRVNKKIKKDKINVPIVHYVAPPVWAWRKWRAKKMHKFIDKLLVLFPWEIGLFDKLNTIFVGHPITTDVDFNHAQIIKRNNYCITLLPGSRESELDKHLPVLEELVSLISASFDNVEIQMPTLEIFEKYLRDAVQGWKIIPKITTSKTDKIHAFYNSDIAIAASGSIVLELAKTRLPLIVFYKTSYITAMIVKLLLQTRWVSLINIILRKDAVPELLQNECTAKNIMKHVTRLLSTKERVIKQKLVLESAIHKITSKEEKIAAKEVLMCANLKN